MKCSFDQFNFRHDIVPKQQNQQSFKEKFLASDIALHILRNQSYAEVAKMRELSSEWATYINQNQELSRKVLIGSYFAEAIKLAKSLGNGVGVIEEITKVQAGLDLDQAKKTFKLITEPHNAVNALLELAKNDSPNKLEYYLSLCKKIADTIEDEEFKSWAFEEISLCEAQYDVSQARLTLKKMCDEK